MLPPRLALWAAILITVPVSASLTPREDPVKPQLTPEGLEKTITLDGLLTHSKALWSFANLQGPEREGVTRSFGSVGYNASADYVEKLARDSGYEVQRYPVKYAKSAIRGSSLTIDGATIPSNGHRPFYFSGNGNITRPLTLISNLGCNLEDFPSTEGNGRIALIIRSNCTFQLKMENAMSFGYEGIIVVDNIDEELGALTLGEDDWERNIPSVIITQAAGIPIIAKLNMSNHAELVASVYVDVYSAAPISQTVVATSTFGDPDKIVMIGAHLDSVVAGPGINDDGSGTATIAELAIQLAKFGGIKNRIRFAWWTTEEFGLIGSTYYVGNLTAEERSKIVAYINLDMTASPNYIIGIYDADNSTGQNTGTPANAGSIVMEQLYQRYYRNHNINYTAYAFTSGSDYRPFIEVDIPAGGVATGAGGIKNETMFQLFGGKIGEQYDQCYHQPCDNIDNLAHDAYLINGRANANILAQLLLDETILEHPPPPSFTKSGPDEHWAEDVKHTCGHHASEI